MLARRRRLEFWSQKKPNLDKRAGLDEGGAGVTPDLSLYPPTDCSACKTTAGFTHLLSTVYGWNIQSSSYFSLYEPPAGKFSLPLNKRLFLDHKGWRKPHNSLKNKEGIKTAEGSGSPCPGGIQAWDLSASVDHCYANISPSQVTFTPLAMGDPFKQTKVYSVLLNECRTLQDIYSIQYSLTLAVKQTPTIPAGFPRLMGAVALALSDSVLLN